MHRPWHFSALFALLLLAAPNPGVGQEEYGAVDFSMSCDETVRSEFDQAVALLHHMMYEQAAERFVSVADADPDCAVAHWGVAMTQLHPLWAPPTEEELTRGRSAAARAEEVGAPTERERAYISAIRAFFETDGSFSDRLRAWEPAQTAVYEQHPGDVDAAAFHALARLATARPEDHSFSRQAEAGALLDRLREQNPRHPGLFHYAIHAYDNPALAERGLVAAREYDRIAPRVPHALHMPSHIFVRLGIWDQVASWNRRSAEAALMHSVAGRTAMHYTHAMDYLVYALLQHGRDEEARAALAELQSRAPFQPHIGTAYALAAPPARLALERRAWEDAAALPVNDPAAFPWDRFPAAEALTWFARGLGSARTGDGDAARVALARLDELRGKLTETGDYWDATTAAQRTAIDAWLRYHSGDVEGAIREMRAAADLEDSVDKHPVTPSSPLPARELLGEMLLDAGRPGDALTAFEASLEISPGRLNSLSGAGRAAELTGDHEAAAHYYGQVAELVDPPVDRPRMEAAHAFLDGS
jgi:tetratricopeptide (TPR) repeat protein